MESGDWTPEAASAIALCENWAKSLSASIACEVYLFGSAIYESGDQFDAQQSDLDLVILLPGRLDATERAERLAALREYKALLEVRMIPALHRTNCEEPGVSLVPIMSTELKANIHKSGARRFFDRNIYLNLDTGLESVGLPNAGTCSIAEEARQAIEYVQRIRNLFLAVSANGTGGIAPFDGADPLPKALARVAAQLVPEPIVGAWYDTRYGLEYIWEELARRRSESEAISLLHRKISIRRGGRGKRLPLTDSDQLLLAEILYDRAAAFPLEPIATWQIRFQGVAPSQENRKRLLNGLRSLVPDAHILGVFEGSVIVMLRSSLRSYVSVSRLLRLEVLDRYFAVSAVDISGFGHDSESEEFKTHSVIDRIAEHIALWRPKRHDSMASTEEEFARWLTIWLSDERVLPESIVTREVAMGGGGQSLRADFVITFRELDQQQSIAVELAHLRKRTNFFHLIERVRKYTLPTIVVLVGTSKQLNELEGDIQKLAAIEGQLRFVPVELESS